MKRKFNFSAGPAMLPFEVMEEAARGLVDYQGSGMGIAEITHRSKAFEKVNTGTIASIRELLSVPEDFAILLLQGGATHQFSMLAMNLLEKRGDYVSTGVWAEKAISEAKPVGPVQVVASSKDDGFTHIPKTIAQGPGADYLHITSNNTVYGTQYRGQFPKPNGCPLIIDASSDIMSRPIDYRDVGMIYAGAQKNLGVSGATLVIIRKDLAKRNPRPLPKHLRYETHIEADSLSNTPCTFAVYVLQLCMQWVKRQGGLAEMQRRAEARAALVYGAIDASGGFYRGLAKPDSRSLMNITFHLPSEPLTEKFLAESVALGMEALKGYRSVGGVRASIYNAMPMEGVETLASFMRDFARKNG